jgi:hypothetical protein
MNNPDTDIDLTTEELGRLFPVVFVPAEPEESERLDENSAKGAVE